MNKPVIERKNKLLLLVGIFISLIGLGGVAYALFNYIDTGSNNTLVTGNIYFNHTQGTNISLTNVAPQNREDARARNDNSVTFSITGLNESDRDVFYKIIINHGDDISSKTRIDDEYLRFDLIEVLSNNTEKYILYDEKIDTINNYVLLRDKVDAGTTSNITRTYKLRMWVGDDIVVSTDNNRDYTPAEWSNLFATLKITVKGRTEKVYYYDSLPDAIDEIDNEAYTSTLSRDDAKAGIYIDSDDHSTNLILYDDVSIEETEDITKPINFNLYGNTIYLPEVPNTNVFLTFYDDVIFENGYISGNGTYNESYTHHVAFQGANGIMRNIEVNADEADKVRFSILVFAYSNITIENCKIGEYGKSNSLVYSQHHANLILKNNDLRSELYSINNSSIELEDSELYSGVEGRRPLTSFAVLIDDTSSLKTDNSIITSDSQGCYNNASDTSYYDCTIGVYNSGTLIMKSGYVFGTSSAVETDPGSKTYVYGTTLESTDHGGFYFNQGPTGVAYVEDATILAGTYSSYGKKRPGGLYSNTLTYNNETYTMETSRSAFYMGGSSANNGQKVYMVNSKLTGLGSYFIVMRYSTPQQELYMSGCDINTTGANPYIRIDNFNSMRLYLGQNNEFHGLNSVKASGSSPISFAEAKELGVLIESNADYKDVISPE